MIRTSNVAILLIVALALSGCSSNCLKPKIEEVRNRLEKELRVGDTRERVEDVLNKADILYSYDRFQNRYQSNITDSRCGPYQGISLYVYFDSFNKMSKVEAFISYTGL